MEADKNNLRWYALQTKTQYERIAAQALESKGYEKFVPLFSRRRRRRDRMYEIEEPLFPGYVFCRFDVNKRLPILVTPFVGSIVSVAKVPTPVEDSEVAALQSVVKSGLPSQPWPFLKVGQWVRITCGAMEDVEGVLIEIKKKHRLVVSVSLLERSVAVDIDEAWVEPIPARDRSRLFEKRSVAAAGRVTQS